MEINKTYLLSAIFAVSLLAGCGSTDTVETESTDTAAEEQAAAEAAEAERRRLAAEEAARLEAERLAAENLETLFYFDFDQATLSSATRADLDAQIAVLKNNDVRIRLEGHADERGTREYNIALGERRANAVANYMVVNGIARFRIETVSYGEERPLATGSDEGSWAQNRRVELK